MSIIKDVYDKQRNTTFPPEGTKLRPQDPEMLYIGCVDARLDPVADIGIKQGRALIYRNIGAMVPPSSEPSPDGTVTASDSVGGVLELFLDLMEKDPPAGRSFKTKHIVVSGHTHCGGLNCCAHCDAPPKGFLKRYLSIFTDAVKTVLGIEPTGDKVSPAEMRAIERESVRRSVENLRSYPIVREAEKKGLVELHGWIIDTATKHISEWDKETNKFERMDERAYRGKHSKQTDDRGFSSPHNRG